jgi:GcrA cell cycle regulator
MMWTDEAVEVLKRLALEGRSASVIAQALGAASRSAVIGKAYRIGVQLNGDGRASARGEKPAGERSAGRIVTRDSRIVPGSRSLPRDGKERKAARSFLEREIGEMRRVRFEEIREFACRWPLGEPGSGEELAYCGLESARGRSYCPGHCRMAYRPPRAKQRAKEARWSGALANPWRLGRWK